MQMEGLGDVADDGSQFQVSIGDVKEHDAIGLEVLKVNVHRFHREKMNRHSITDEGVYADSIEPLLRVFHKQASFSNLHGYLGRGTGHITEPVFGNGFN